jgi:uncharacterized protein (DUF433 family)
MIELTLEQVRALAQAGNPPTVVDPTTRQVYVLMPAYAPHAAGGGGAAYSGVGSGASQEADALVETPVAPWKHLVARKHPWRKQLYIKGRNMTVRQLVGGIKANKFTEEQAAANYHLPVEAIREALRYFDENPEVIELDAAHERYLEKLRGRGRGPESVPR